MPDITQYDGYLPYCKLHHLWQSRTLKKQVLLNYGLAVFLIIPPMEQYCRFLLLLLPCQVELSFFCFDTIKLVKILHMTKLWELIAPQRLIKIINNKLCT